MVRHDELGKASVTICRVLAHFGSREAGGAAGGRAGGPPPPITESNAFSLVELELKTGRTHQIRVHLSHLGFPIVADDMYSGRIPAFSDDPAGLPPVIERHALHASLLSFRHPHTGETMTFTAPFPADMATLVARLRALPPGPVAYTPPGTMLQAWAAELLATGPAA